MQHTHQVQDVLVLGSDFHTQGPLMEKQPIISDQIFPQQMELRMGTSPLPSPRTFWAEAPRKTCPSLEMFMLGEADAEGM